MAESPNPRTNVINLEKAVSLLKKGEPVAFPTETVYGLGASIFSPEAIEKIFVLKGRPSDNPLIIHIANFSQLEQIAEWYPEDIAKQFWPGPLTLLLPKKKSVDNTISAGLPLVGVRMPSHPMARELIEWAGPLAAPSANLSGRPSSTSAEHVRADFGDKVFILDGGPSQHGLESTVLKLDPPTILRPGSITKEELETFIGARIEVADEKVEKPLSPGMKYKHYSPHAKVHLVHEEPKQKSKRFIIRNITPENLYAFLRKGDQEGYEEIFILLNSRMQSDLALMNRLIRAAE